MNQSERRRYLINYLINEHKEYKNIEIPNDSNSQKYLLRSLMNVRVPGDISKEFLDIQDEYLKEENLNKGIVTIDDIERLQPDLYLYKGDITRLKADAIVNAANSGMTGCYMPSHNCIDNCIHTFAGIELRNYCDQLMKKQGHQEPTGKAKITPAFNLPCNYVIHTVGPIVDETLTNKHKDLLKSCYLECLKLANENNIDSIAFCCISTGMFMFPNDIACEIAINTVKEYKKDNNSNMKVIFNVFKDEDERLYRERLK